MGQKVNPIGFRVAIDKQWRSRWFSGKKEFGDLLAEDQKIRAAVLRELKTAVFDEGTRMRRHWARARGSASPIARRLCHVKVVLTDESGNNR